MLVPAVVQGFEGLGLGVVIALSNLHLCRKALLAVIFCATTPIGIAIGIGMQRAYDPDRWGCVPCADKAVSVSRASCLLWPPPPLVPLLSSSQ